MRIASNYTVVATVRRAHGTKRIEWTFEGKGSGTLAWNMWRKMRQIGKTTDTYEPFISASLARCAPSGDVIVESIGDGVPDAVAASMDTETSPMPDFWSDGSPVI